MNIFSIIKNLYINPKSDWINQLEDDMIQPYVLQRWLCMNDKIRIQTRWLDKYVFVLTPKMYLSLAWSVIPKSNKPPFVKYIKQLEDESEFDFIFKKIRRHMEMSDNDFYSVKGRLLKIIKDNMAEWFCFYGVEKKYWKKYLLDFKLIESYKEKDKPKVDLNAWGI